MSRGGQEERKEGRREFSELLLEPEKSFLPLKSSRCGPVPEKEKEAERWREIKKEGRGFINPWPSTYIIISPHSTSKTKRLGSVKWFSAFMEK